MRFMAGKDFTYELAKVFGVDKCRICHATIDSKMRGAVTVTFTHIVEDHQAAKIKEILAGCAESVEVHNKPSIALEIDENDNGE